MVLPRISSAPSTLTDPEQERVLSMRLATATNKQPGLARLRSILLRIGGAQLVSIGYEENLTQILYLGRAFRGSTAYLRVGQPSACHSNVCSIYEAEGFGSFRIWTGYALSEDGLWRQHSWGQLVGDDWVPQDRGRLVETTVKRLAYFGFGLNARQAENFCDANW